MTTPDPQQPSRLELMHVALSDCETTLQAARDLIDEIDRERTELRQRVRELLDTSRVPSGQSADLDLRQSVPAPEAPAGHASFGCTSGHVRGVPVCHEHGLRLLAGVCPRAEEHAERQEFVGGKG